MTYRENETLEAILDLVVSNENLAVSIVFLIFLNSDMTYPTCIFSRSILEM